MYANMSEIMQILLTLSMVCLFFTNAKLVRRHEEVLIKCDINDKIEMIEGPNSTISPKTVYISNCPMPNISYAASFSKRIIDVTNTTKLDLEMPEIQSLNCSEEQVIKANSFENLTLQELEIWAPIGYNNKICYKMEDYFLKPMSSKLRKLQISGILVPPLYEMNHIENITLERAISMKEWGYCKELKYLTLRQWKVQEITSIAHCQNLTVLKLIDMPHIMISRVLAGLKSLIIFEMVNCQFIFDNELLSEQINLQTLKLKSNSITTISQNAFKNLKDLKELDLSNNFLYNVPELMEALKPLKQLEILNLDKNPELHSCDILRWPTVHTYSLRYMRLSYLCFKTWTNVTFLDLSHNKITSLELTQLPNSDKHNVLVDLRNNSITKIPIGKETYDDVIDKYSQVKNITVLIDAPSIDCDCQHGWSARALRSLPNLHLVGNISCSNGVEFASVEVEHLECDKSTCGECVCRKNWIDNTTDIDCRNAAISAIPTVENLRKLNAHHNRIERLYVENFPETLLFADLTNNRISSLSTEVVKAIFSVRTRILLLADNPLVCGCDAYALLSALYYHRAQVLDYENITCANDGRAVKDIAITSLCASPSDPTISIVVSVITTITIVLVFLVLYHRFKNRLQVYLFSKGFCLSCLGEEDIDFERHFDAFLTFCHLDEEFIIEKILPELAKFRLCIHYRDWMAGEWIPKQIAVSIEQSRRIIMVLSNNYLASSWGMLEFRMAHAATLQEGRRRLITIVIDDVTGSPHLDAELRGYLAANTYIKWGDPWFNKKLIFAMPHNELRCEGENDETDTGIDLQDLAIAAHSYRHGCINQGADISITE